MDVKTFLVFGFLTVCSFVMLGLSVKAVAVSVCRPLGGMLRRVSTVVFGTASAFAGAAMGALSMAVLTPDNLGVRGHWLLLISLCCVCAVIAVMFALRPQSTMRAATPVPPKTLVGKLRAAFASRISSGTQAAQNGEAPTASSGVVVATSVFANDAVASSAVVTPVSAVVEPVQLAPVSAVVAPVPVAVAVAAVSAKHVVAESTIAHKVAVATDHLDDCTDHLDNWADEYGSNSSAAHFEELDPVVAYLEVNEGGAAVDGTCPVVNTAPAVALSAVIASSVVPVVVLAPASVPTLVLEPVAAPACAVAPAVAVALAPAVAQVVAPDLPTTTEPASTEPVSIVKFMPSSSRISSQPENIHQADLALVSETRLDAVHAKAREDVLELDQFFGNVRLRAS